MAEPVSIEVGATGTLAGQEFTAKESCGSNVGRWACVTHDKVFVNQFNKDTHISSSNKPCTLAWVCLNHGVEKP